MDTHAITIPAVDYLYLYGLNPGIGSNTAEY